MDMANAAARFDDANTFLTDTLKKLMNDLADLQTTWVGSGGQAFDVVKNRYNDDVTKLNAALAQTAEAIRTSGVSYDSTDSSAASDVAKSGGGGYTLPL